MVYWSQITRQKNFEHTTPHGSEKPHYFGGKTTCVQTSIREVTPLSNFLVYFLYSATNGMKILIVHQEIWQRA
jgi:hypothetical protein